MNSERSPFLMLWEWLEIYKLMQSVRTCWCDARRRGRVFAQLDLTSENIIHSPFSTCNRMTWSGVEPNKARIVEECWAFLPYVLSSTSRCSNPAIAIR